MGNSHSSGTPDGFSASQRGLPDSPTTTSAIPVAPLIGAVLVLSVVVAVVFHLERMKQAIPARKQHDVFDVDEEKSQISEQLKF
jgi:hypothetical protein